MNGAATCSRLGCDRPAVAVFAFDARERLVWLDPMGAGGPGAGVLCDVHADRMSPPRGWNLLDRRAAEARLWIGRAGAAAPAAAGRRRARPGRTRSCVSAPPRLPFEGDENEPPVCAPVDATPWSPHARPGPELDHVLEARTPLLARAFEAARPSDDA